MAFFDTFTFDIYYKIFRHHDALARLNGKRTANLIRLIAEIKKRRTVLKSRPIFLRINPVPFCNLSCPICPLGQKKLGIREEKKTEAILSLDDYRRILDKTGDWLLKAVLYDEGEPLLHPDLPEMVAIAADKNISTVISTNLAMELTDRRLKDIVDSGLSHLIVAIDGMSQDIYSMYRIGGDLEIVKNNLERLVSLKGKYPLVEFQFIRFGYNNHQLAAARQYAKSLGVERFSSFDSIWHPDQRYERDKSRRLPPEERRRLGCFDIYTVMNINSQGVAYPCDHGEDYGFSPLGLMLEKDFQTIWNAPLMVELRESFRRGETPRTICLDCHLESYLPKFLR